MSKTKQPKYEGNIVGLILRAGYVESQRPNGLFLTHLNGGFSTPKEAFIDFVEKIREVCECTNNYQLVDAIMQIYNGDNDSISYDEVWVPLEELGWSYGELGEGNIAEIHAFDYLGKGFCSMGSGRPEDKFDCYVYNVKKLTSENVIVPFFKFEEETEEHKLKVLLDRLSYEEKKLLGIDENKLLQKIKAKKA